MKGLVKVVSIVICILAMGWTILILASAKILGNAVLIAESDAYVALALNVLAIPALIVMMVSMRRASTRQKRHAAATAAAQSAYYGQPAAYPFPPGQPPAHQPGFSPPPSAQNWGQ